MHNLSHYDSESNSGLKQMQTLRDFEVLIIGAGHNGLAAARVLAGKGIRVLVLEKNAYVGGMAGTREIFKGCRNEVGASCLFPIADEILDYFKFERYGVEFIELPVMAINLVGGGHKPLIFYSQQRRQMWHILRNHGLAAMLGFIKLFRFIAYPASVMDRFTPGLDQRDAELRFLAAVSIQRVSHCREDAVRLNYRFGVLACNVDLVGRLAGRILVHQMY